MSQEEALSRKDKKAQRDAERKKGKKRKHDEAEEPPALPEAADEEEVVADVKDTTKASKKRKGTDDDGASEAPQAAEAGASQPKKKRRRKTKSEEEKPSRNRFIVFVGNLPYKTTDDSLDKHFAKLKPYTLRHRTDPKTKKSKGFAFLEFENYDRMKTCLKLYHHSMFDPEAIERGEAPIEPGAEAPVDTSMHPSRRGKKKETARRINVELTAGGGGGTEGRKEKIKTKNAKLDEERKRRADEERKQKEIAAKKAGKSKSGANAEKVKGDKKTIVKELQEKAAAAERDTDNSHGIHPSRLARMD